MEYHAYAPAMALYLVPMDEPSYRATVAEPLDLSDWENRPDDFPATARVWGVRTDPAQDSWERNQQTWERMESGEPLLFYLNGTGEFVAHGRIGVMCETDYIRDEYWNGGPAITVYTVEDYDDSVSVSLDEAKSILSYDDGFVLRGTHRVSEDRPVDRLLRQATSR